MKRASGVSKKQIKSNIRSKKPKIQSSDTIKGQSSLLNYLSPAQTKSEKSSIGSLERLICSVAKPKWIDVLQSQFGEPYFSELDKFIASQRASEAIYPDEDNTFTWMEACDFDQVKIVIIGQDPYHNPNQAHGLCFSVRFGQKPPPRLVKLKDGRTLKMFTHSLLNIFRELNSDLGIETPDHGCLIGWARQGVLLLNVCLTVVKNKPNSHKGKGWEVFTDHVIKSIADQLKNVVFVLWGKDAEKKRNLIGKDNNHTTLSSTHPSPLSAHRGFLGCRHFSKANEVLQSAGIKPIDWSQLPAK